MIHIPTIYYQVISNHMEVMAYTNITPQTNVVEITKKQSKWELPFLHMTGLVNLTYIPTKYYQESQRA